MTNVRTIHVDWYNRRSPSFHGGPQLAYQGDHLSNMVVFDNAPELPNYYLLVEMKTDEAGPVVTLPEILLEGAYWVIPNYYTQICQKITYQVCCKTESEDFEHHSAKFEGTILPVIKHNGEPVDQSPMFDPYIDILDKRVDELIVAAGDIQIDSELKSDSGNPVQNRVVKAAIDGLEDDVDAVNARLNQQQNDYYSDSKIVIDLSQYTENVGYAWHRTTLKKFAAEGYTALDPIPVEANTNYELYIKAGSAGSQRAYVLTDENGTKIAEADAVFSYQNITCSISTKNAGFLYITYVNAVGPTLSRIENVPAVKNETVLLSDEVGIINQKIGDGFFVDGETITLNTVTGSYITGNIGDSIRINAKGSTAYGYIDAIPGGAYKLGFSTFAGATDYVFAVDESDVVIKKWISGTFGALTPIDTHVVAPVGTSKIYFNYQQYHEKYAQSTTIVPISASFPPLSRNDWKKCFTLSAVFIEGYYLKSGTGIAYASVNWKSTDFIEVKAEENIRYSLFGYTNENAAICFYDVDKQYVSEVRYSASNGYYAAGEVTVGQDGYIRVSVRKEENNNSSLVFTDYLPTDGMMAAIKQDSVLADFLNNEYRETMYAVQQVSTPDTASFVFLTDLHYAVSHMYAVYCSAMERNYTAIKRIASEMPMSVIVAGGDYEMLGNASSGVTKQDGLDIIYHLNRYMSQMPVPNIALGGNHELGYNSGGEAATISGTDNGLTNDEVYTYIGKKYSKSSIKKAGKEVYYLIDDVNGVFFLFLSTTTPGRLTMTDTLAGIDIALAANTELYPIVVFNHYSLTSAGELFNSAIQSVIEKIVTSGNEIVAWIGGHNHADWCNTVTVNGVTVLIISCLQSGALNSNTSQDGVKYAHTVGTDTESAFSVFTVNKTLGKLYLTRFGAGVDREFNYNATSGPIGLVTDTNG